MAQPKNIHPASKLHLRSIPHSSRRKSPSPRKKSAIASGIVATLFVLLAVAVVFAFAMGNRPASNDSSSQPTADELTSRATVIANAPVQSTVIKPRAATDWPLLNHDEKISALRKAWATLDLDPELPAKLKTEDDWARLKRWIERTHSPFTAPIVFRSYREGNSGSRKNGLVYSVDEFYEKMQQSASSWDVAEFATAAVKKLWLDAYVAFGTE